MLSFSVFPLDDRNTPTQIISAADAYDKKMSAVWVQAQGTVVKILSDDTDGSRHQRFILRLESGQTLLIAHNIDIAQRVSVITGTYLEVLGLYEWNPKGGVVHWTHHDPAGQKRGGWIRLKDKVYD